MPHASMHAVVLRLPAREVRGNHHTPKLRGDDHRGCGIGADRSSNLDLVNRSAIHPMTAFHRIPIMRIGALNTCAQYDGCSDEKKKTNTDITGPEQTLVGRHGNRPVSATGPLVP